MTRKTPLCRTCGMPMKGHSKSGCLVPKLQSSVTVNPQPTDDGTSIISSTPSFIIPETGPFRRQNPNYVLQPPPEVEALVVSSASFTPTEPVYSVNTMKRSLPSLQQFTPDWSRPSSPRTSRQVLKQRSSPVPESASVAPPVFDARLVGDSVKLVACIYEVPTTTVEAFRARAVSNGLYSIPIEPLRESFSDERMPPSTWIVTGPVSSDVDALVAISQPRTGFIRRVSQIRPIAIMQVVRNLDAVHITLILLLLCAFKLIFKW